MTNSRLIISSLAALVCTFTASLASAHGDPEIPLYVAEDGLDSGRCDNQQAPCASISYALGQAGKGTEIRVAEGTYEITNTEDLFHLLSDVVKVVGGYQSPMNPSLGEPAMSTLTGVPVEYRALLQERGFHVIADRKGIEGPRAAEAARLLSLHETLQSSLPLTPCSNGDAAGLPCEAVDLVAHVAFTDVSSIVGTSNDVWGFVDLNTNREYVIAGFNTGTAVFDVSDPESPQEIGFVAGQNAVWRDIKVYQYFDDAAARWKAYAYVTTDGVTDGMIVIDLTGLPHFIVKRNYVSDFSAAHNVYVSNTEFSTGVSLTGDTPSIIVAGANIGNGRYRAYSLANPASPTFIEDAPITTDRYMHDAASIIITDSRKDTQCVNAATYCNVLLDFNENTIEIWDITDPASPAQLSSTPYANSSYVHSGWWSEDKQFMFVHDELDEQGFGLQTTVRIFSLADLTNPLLAGTWSGPTTAIDHNGFVRGNRYYMSNYARGLTVLDISNPAQPVEVGRLDTYPFTDGSSFVGAWGAYPYLPSGTIAISDIDSGVYLASDETRAVAEGQLSFSKTTFGADEGQQIQLTVDRSGGSAGNVGVDFEIVNATTDAADVQTASGSLAWTSGDIAPKSILLTATADGVDEGLEQMIVRLIAPIGGATLGNANAARVYVSDPGDMSVVQFSSAGIDIAENDGVPAILILQRYGSAVGATSVDYTLTAGDAVSGVNFEGNTSGTVNWADGDATPKTIEFTILDDNQNNPSSFIELTLSNAIGAGFGTNASVQLVIEDGAGSNQAPVSNAGTSQTLDEATVVTLDGSQSNDPDGTNLDYEWTQTSGQAVTLSNTAAVVTTFTAPSVGSDSMLQFQLTVYDVRGSDSSSNTTITVINTDPGNGGGHNNGGGKGGGALGWLALLLLLLPGLRWRRVIQKDDV